MFVRGREGFSFCSNKDKSYKGMVTLGADDDDDDDDIATWKRMMPMSLHR